MKRILLTIYNIFVTLLLLTGYALAFFFAWKKGTGEMISVLIGMVYGFVFAPIFHEMGHLWFAQIGGMEYVYFKAFCLRFVRKDGKIKFSFASPFAADQTQVVPKRGGNMKKRAARYAVGGLLVEGIVFLVLLTAAILCTVVGGSPFVLWAMTPYFAYLFLLNAIPATLASGKTDAAVYLGIKKGYDAEQNMLAAMEIQGQLYEGKSFSEIDEKWYFNVPQLCEDEPLFAVMLDLRYRYYLEKGDFDNAADQLNRLAQTQAYLPDCEVEKIAAELAYMHAINDDIERANECEILCENYLSQDIASAHRIKAALARLKGDLDEVTARKARAEKALEKERIKGNAVFERILLSRL